MSAYTVASRSRRCSGPCTTRTLWIRAYGTSTSSPGQQPVPGGEHLAGEPGAERSAARTGAPSGPATAAGSAAARRGRRRASTSPTIRSGRRQVAHRQQPVGLLRVALVRPAVAGHVEAQPQPPLAAPQQRPGRARHACTRSSGTVWLRVSSRPVARPAGPRPPRASRKFQSPRTRRTGCRITPAIAVSVLAMPMNDHDRGRTTNCKITNATPIGSDERLRGQQLADHQVAVGDRVQRAGRRTRAAVRRPAPPPPARHRPATRPPAPARPGQQPLAQRARRRRTVRYASGASVLPPPTTSSRSSASPVSWASSGRTHLDGLEPFERDRPGAPPEQALVDPQLPADHVVAGVVPARPPTDHRRRSTSTTTMTREPAEADLGQRLPGQRRHDHHERLGAVQQRAQRVEPLAAARRARLHLAS